MTMGRANLRAQFPTRPTPIWAFVVAVLACTIWTADSEVRNLGGKGWTVSNHDGSMRVNATVPGGIYTDLMNGGVIKDYIFFEKNDMEYRWVGLENSWKYSTVFTLTKEDLGSDRMNLVFHGLDTIASIWVNGNNVGTSTNMFVRSVYNIKKFVEEGKNNLDVKFKSPVEAGKQLANSIGYTIPPTCPNALYHGECNVNQLRKMQASFSWDWGPAFPSVGIWKDVELELMKSNRLRDVGFRTLDLDTDKDYYVVEVTAWFEEPQARGRLNIILPLDYPEQYTANFSSMISVKNGFYKTKLRLLKNSISLWWPRGYGNPSLYKMSVEFISNGEVQRKNLQVGIRTVSIVQTPIVYNKPAQGQTFYLTVNRVPIFVKGANWIPMDVLPERGADEERLANLLDSATEANFNSLRVWGGGVYESDLFYKYCDRKGILIWQDLMFACAMYPATGAFLESVAEEVSQQVRRLHHHPSVFAYGGNNENEAALVQNWLDCSVFHAFEIVGIRPVTTTSVSHQFNPTIHRYGTTYNFTGYANDFKNLYVSTIKPIVESLDNSRPYFTSSPSNGDETEREGFISSNPQSNSFGDVHFYIYMANMWNPMIYPTPRFASEYGMQSFPSVHTLAKAVSPQELYWESDVLMWRQHSPGGTGYIEAQIEMNLPSSRNLADMVYLSQINQAMAMKTETEHYRAYKTILNDANEGRTMGALYWQLNDVWEAPTWSSIDYQGIWKMLHYYARNFFTDLLVIAEQKLDTVEVYVVSDANILTSPQPIDVSVVTYVHKWDSFDPIDSRTKKATMDPESSMLLYKSYLSDLYNGSNKDYFLTFEMDGPDFDHSSNFLFPTALKNSNFPNATVQITRIRWLEAFPRIAVIELTTDANALFVWLESPLQTWSTRFTENGFHMFSPKKSVIVTDTRGLTKKFFDSLTVRNLKKQY